MAAGCSVPGFRRLRSGKGTCLLQAGMWVSWLTIVPSQVLVSIDRAFSFSAPEIASPSPLDCELIKSRATFFSTFCKIPIHNGYYQKIFGVMYYIWGYVLSSYQGRVVILT